MELDEDILTNSKQETEDLQITLIEVREELENSRKVLKKQEKSTELEAENQVEKLTSELKNIQLEKKSLIDSLNYSHKLLEQHKQKILDLSENSMLPINTFK